MGNVNKLTIVMKLIHSYFQCIQTVASVINMITCCTGMDQIDLCLNIV